MPRLLALLLLSFTIALTACPSTGQGDDDDPANLPVVPDPGDAAADWGFDINDVCCSTPETAHAVGVVNDQPGYIQGVIDEDLNFFYVFRAGSSLTEFTFPNSFDEVHLNEGAGLRFGNLIDPSVAEEFSTTWDVEPDAVYVVEIISAVSGFF